MTASRARPAIALAATVVGASAAITAALAPGGPDRLAVVVVAAAWLMAAWAVVVVRRGHGSSGDARVPRPAGRDRPGPTAGADGEEGRFRSVVERSSDIVTIVAPDGTVLYRSPSAERVLGPSPPGVVGTRLDRLLHPHDRRQALAALRRAAGVPGGSARVEARLRRTDGTWCLTETSIDNLLDVPSVGGLVLVTRDVGHRQALEDDLRHRALHDPLTGLGNRQLFGDRLDHALSRRRREPLTVLFMDLDGFKAVNDSLGHAAGDELLGEVAERLTACVRPEDTVARLGGDEFAVLLEQADATVAVEVAERILVALRLPFVVASRPVVVSGSLGVVVADLPGTRSDDVLRDADAAMYRAKTRGRGRYELFEATMEADASDRLLLEDELRRAIPGGELDLWFQPIYDLGEARIVEVEALVRWRHPQRGLLLPATFVALAEHSGLIHPLGAWVLRRACAAAAEWRSEGVGDGVGVTVNVSVRQLQDPVFYADVDAALAASALPPDALILEVTESVLMDDVALAALVQLQGVGVRIAVDDFGTGWSSLSRLATFPIDALKIDRSLVAGLAPDRSAPSVVASIIDLGRGLGVRVVAEGVETAAQRSYLAAHDCDAAQGFLLARPMPLDEVVATLAADTASRAIAGSPLPPATPPPPC